MNQKVLVLSSGGIDSTTLVARAVEDYGYENVITVCVSYGQKHKKEINCAHAVADYYEIPCYGIDLSSVLRFSNCALMNNSTNEIPRKSYDDQVKENGPGSVATFVPFRNGLMISAAISFAQSIAKDDEEWQVWIGCQSNDVDGETYPDCSSKFVHTMDKAASIATEGKVNVYAPISTYSKKDVVTLGLSLGAPYHLTWSCYNGEDKACGVCGTCRDRLKAFKENGSADPIEYETILEAYLIDQLL